MKNNKENIDDYKQNNNSSFFYSEPKLPPLEERTDSYSKTKLKTDKLLKIYERLK